MMTLYRSIYWVILCIMFPMLLWKNWRSAFGRLFPKKIPEETSCIWVHAVSVGEVKAVAPVVHELYRRNPKLILIVSTITETGLETAKAAIPEARHVFRLPFDLRFSIRRIGVTPSLVLLSEGDVWPVFLDEARKEGARIAVVNAKMSETSLRRLRYWLPFGKWLYSHIDRFYAQNDLFATRFAQVGVDPSSVVVEGTTKADIPFEMLSDAMKEEWRATIGLRDTDKVVTIGSTHDPEELMLLDELRPLVGKRCKLIVVPRHPERSHEVFRAYKEKARSVLYSDLTKTPAKGWEVLIVDRLGMLTTLYQLSHVAVVAGSFLPRIGGHNILEPALAGIPVIVGPYMHSQAMLFQSAMEEEAIIQTEMTTIRSTVDHLLTNEAQRMEFGSKAHRWASKLHGTAKRIVDDLVKLGYVQS